MPENMVRAYKTVLPIFFATVPTTGFQDVPHSIFTHSEAMKKSVLGVIGDQYTRVPPVATTDLSGQTVIVVGANTGLGFEATKHFARMNPGRLILACRNKEKGVAAAYSTS